jgi:FkbM family methyltransferase
VFVNRIYEVAAPDPPVVIDIGMNVGITSIFFAKTLGCHVYSYEPFKDTFKKAIANINLNPEISDKIYAFQYAVGSKNREAEFIFCPDSPGDCGIVSIPEGYRQNREVYKEIVEIVSASEVVDFVQRKEPYNDIILKLDCEGMEYEIIHCLSRAGLISNIRAILMEWHRRGNLGDPSELQVVLKRSGFITFGNPFRESEVGMLFGVNILNPAKRSKQIKDIKSVIV